MELGSVYRRLGSEVEVVEFADMILPNFDHEVNKEFLKILKKDGMTFHLSHKVVGGSVNNNMVTLQVEDVKVRFISLLNMNSTYIFTAYSCDNLHSFLIIIHLLDV